MYREKNSKSRSGFEKKVLKPEEAYQQALRFLEPRFLSSYELRKKLQTKGVESSVIDEIETRLIELDYLNDERLAVQVLRLYVTEAKYGRMYIRNKMRLRGLDTPESISEYDELKAALAQVRKKFKEVDFSISPYGGKDPRHKIIGFLKNRGFDTGTIKIVLESITCEANYE